MDNCTQLIIGISPRRRRSEIGGVKPRARTIMPIESAEGVGG